MVGWIAVDLDGTLAEYHTGDGIDAIGAPIAAMVERVKRWLDQGRVVRIFTARVGPHPSSPDFTAFIDAQRELIQAWCAEHIGVRLDVTCQKDFGMMELWDDRAVQVVPNTGARADGES